MGVMAKQPHSRAGPSLAVLKLAEAGDDDVKAMAQKGRFACRPKPNPGHSRPVPLPLSRIVSELPAKLIHKRPRIQFGTPIPFPDLENEFAHSLHLQCQPGSSSSLDRATLAGEILATAEVRRHSPRPKNSRPHGTCKRTQSRHLLTPSRPLESICSFTSSKRRRKIEEQEDKGFENAYYESRAGA